MSDKQREQAACASAPHEPMRILLYTEGMKFLKISGLGRAILHQQRALDSVGIPYTTDPKDPDWDIVHINYFGLKSKRLAKKAHRLGKKVVYHAHSTEEDFRNSFFFANAVSGLFKKWIRSCYVLGDVIATPTEYSKQLLRDYGIKKPIFAVSNGIDLDFYQPSENDRADFRKQFGLKDTDKVVIAVGLYFERKGILDFVEMAKSMPDYRFIWFGKTAMYSVPHKIRRAVRTRLPNLTFAGYVPPETLKKAYAGSDVYIFPTYEETEGIVLLEALASRANVIVRDIPAFDWLQKDIDCYKASDNQEFMAKITAVVSGSIPSLKEAGYRAVEDKSIDKVGIRLKEIYDTAIKI